MIYLQLFWEFFKTGLFAVGGGMATIPFLYNMAETTGWFTTADVNIMVAVGESTPGPIGVNMATYVGFVTGVQQNGILTAILGAVIATLGLITPSVIVILIVAAFLQQFRNSRYVNNAFYGLRPASTGLIAAAGISVARIALLHAEELVPAYGVVVTRLVHWPAVLLAVGVFVCMKFTPLKKLHPIAFIAISAVLGILFQM